MPNLDVLRQKVRSLYESKNPNRADWADWIYENHVLVVAESAKKLAERFGANKELSEAAGLLHDVADAVMKRNNKRHEEESKNIARKLLRESDFTENEIQTIIEDAIAFHSCRDNNLPKTLEGKILATADALAHLKTDFYKFALKTYRQDGKSDEEIKTWVLDRIERDYSNKIFFDEVKQEIAADYKNLKDLFLNI